MVLSQSQAGEGRQSQSLSLPAVGGVRRVASKVKDHTVLVNLAELCGQALPLRPGLLHTWAPRLWREVSLWAATYPQVSAWYKLALLLVREGAHRHQAQGQPARLRGSAGQEGGRGAGLPE